MMASAKSTSITYPNGSYMEVVVTFDIQHNDIYIRAYREHASHVHSKILKVGINSSFLISDVLCKRSKLFDTLSCLGVGRSFNLSLTQINT